MPGGERQVYDARVREQQAKDPAWMKIGRGTIDALGGATKGLLGQDPAEDASNSEYIANALTQLGSAGEGALKGGLPLLKLTGGKPIFHGTQKVFNEFDAAKNDTSDVLGWMTHGTPKVDYAEQYAMGSAKHGSIDVNDPYFDLNYKNAGRTPPRPNIIPMKPEAQNTLDLIDPNPDDLSAALAGMDSNNREHYKSLFKRARRDPSGHLDYLDINHYPREVRHKIPDDEVPMRVLADKLRMDPHELDRTQFDAIRYHDMSNESYAASPVNL